METGLAITPQNNDAFFREVDEELRRDRVERFVRRRGRIVLALVALGLLVLAALLYWQHRREQQAGLEGEQLTQAMSALGEREEARAAPLLAALARSPHGAYAALARLAQADAALEKNDMKAAVAGFKAVADDEDLPQPFRDLARIRQTTLEYDGLKPAEVVARMTPLATAGGPWFGSAGELVAAARLKMGERAAAAALFAALARDRTVPQTIRSRAGQMAGTLGVAVEPEQAPAAAR